MKRTYFLYGMLVLICLCIVGRYAYIYLEIPIWVKPYEKNITKDHYEVIVVGGEPEGVAAAVSAARNGADVLLIEKRNALGGLFTFGELNYLDIPKDEDNEITSEGIFREWHKLMRNVITFDIERAKLAFMKLVQKEENITLSLTTNVIDVVMEGHTLTGVKTKDETGTRIFTGKRFIDTTADAELAALAGVPYTIGQEDFGRNHLMSATLVIHLKDVNWKQIKKVAASRQFGKAEVTKEAAWGFYGIQDQYEEIEKNTNIRGLNIGRTHKGDVYINALQIFGINGLDPASVENGLKRGKRETDHFVKFLKDEFPGFEDAKIVSYPSELYIRETRHIEAEYRVTTQDLWENKITWDTIAFGSYPIDIQATSNHQLGYIVFKPDHYGIPYRSIVPKNVENLIVTSKASGFDSIPAGSIRVVPTGMAVAEAGGLIAAMSIDLNLSFRDFIDRKHIKAAQAKLKEQGAFFKKYPNNYSFPFKNDPDYEPFITMVSLGLVSTGYENYYNLDKKINKEQFLKLLKMVIVQTDLKNSKKMVTLLQTLNQKDKDDAFTKVEAYQLINALGISVRQEQTQDLHTPLKARDAFRLLHEVRGILLP
jgi:hypothetical protein